MVRGISWPDERLFGSKESSCSRVRLQITNVYGHEQTELKVKAELHNKLVSTAYVRHTWPSVEW
jgi:hypothetical protein